jgi:uncharacterized protein YndB with AHSA1/START domain
MATETLELEVVIPASPEDIFNAWMDAEIHAAFTGSDATGACEEGAAFTAWDGYISGVHMELEPARRIVQTWRSTDFPPDHADSRLEVLLEDHPKGALLRLVHSDVPQGQGDALTNGWIEYYFEPLKRHFGAKKKRKAPAKKKKAAAKKKKAPAVKKKKAVTKKKQKAPAAKKAPAKKKKKVSRRK